MSDLIIQNKLLFPEILWKRPVNFYKAQAGKIFVLAGSKGMSGAATLACEAIFRSGTGVLVLGFPEGLKSIYKNILPEAMTLPLPQTLHQTISKKAEDLILEQSKGFDAAVIGPGLSENAETIQLIWDLIFKLEITVILDADGINALAKGIEVARSKEDIDFIRDYFKKKKCELLITPHPGEALRILKALKPKELEGQKLTTQYINTHKEDIAPLLAEILSSTVVLKGNNTVIADPSGRKVMDMIGGPELAVSGSGDVLAGIVGSFVGQNKNKVFESACTGVFLHSKSGSIAKDHVGERSVIASDIIRYLPEAIKEAESEL